MPFSLFAGTPYGPPHSHTLQTRNLVTTALRRSRPFRGGVLSSLGDSRSLAISPLLFQNLALRLEPVLVCRAFAPGSLLVEFIGPFGDLRCQIERVSGQQWGFSRVKNPISKQFDAVIHEEPSQSVAPDERCPSPAERCHKQSINRYQRRHNLRAKHRYP